MKILKLTLFLGAAAVLLLFAADRTPQIHSYFLRKTAGSNVVLVTNEAETGGGTGFLVKGASGNVYILTNSHVCAIGETYVEKKRVFIVKNSRPMDLCALAPTSRRSSISLRSDPPTPGEILNVIGHPKLDPRTLTSGEYVADKQIFIGFPPLASGGCEQGEFSVMGGLACIKRQVASISTIQILGGNSGSPVVDYWGRLVGVMFGAGQGDRGVFTRHQDVKAFLEGL